MSGRQLAAEAQVNIQKFDGSEVRIGYGSGSEESSSLESEVDVRVTMKLKKHMQPDKSIVHKKKMKHNSRKWKRKDIK